MLLGLVFPFMYSYQQGFYRSFLGIAALHSVEYIEQDHNQDYHKDYRSNHRVQLDGIVVQLSGTRFQLPVLSALLLQVEVNIRL